MQRPIAFKHLVRSRILRHTLGPNLVRGLTEGQRLSLGKDVRHQHVVMTTKCIQRLEEPDKVARNQPRPLVG